MFALVGGKLNIMLGVAVHNYFPSPPPPHPYLLNINISRIKLYEVYLLSFCAVSSCELWNVT